MQEKGFTLVELVVVFSIMALLSIAGLASFAAFSQRQLLANSISDLRTILNVARTRTISQVNASPNGCTTSQQFGGYVVIVCCNQSGGAFPINCPNNPTCIKNTDDYELYETCNNGSSPASYQFIQGGKFASGVGASISSTARTFQFSPITGNVTYGSVSGSSGTVTLTSSFQNKSGSVTVTSVGEIQ